jgi:hypothetical protein
MNMMNATQATSAREAVEARFGRPKKTVKKFESQLDKRISLITKNMDNDQAIKAIEDLCSFIDATLEG